MAAVTDYLKLSAAQAREQFRDLLARRQVTSGKQGLFRPVETFLCLAAGLVVDRRRYGGGRSASSAPEPVQSLARLFSRPPSSVLEKMANLDGVRPHGALSDAAVGAELRSDVPRFARLYRLILNAARAEGIGPSRLPDFLGLEQGGELELLGQHELDPAVVEAAVRGADDGDDRADPETVRARMAAARVGQHRFAFKVLDNCGGRCMFCGLDPAVFGGRRMLVASHIKPWKDSSPRERLDHRNGLAACPTHDAAFDAGLLSVDEDLHVHLADQLAVSVEADSLVRQYFGQPPLQPVLRLPAGADLPDRRYLTWHRSKVFTDRVNGSC